MNCYCYVYLLSLLETILYVDCIRGVESEGMLDVKYGNKGNLYFEFDIEFPPNNFLDIDKMQVRSSKDGSRHQYLQLPIVIVV